MSEYDKNRVVILLMSLMLLIGAWHCGETVYSHRRCLVWEHGAAP